MTIFEKIATRDVPAHIIWENDTHLAFLDIHPWVEGHTLVVPKTNPGDELFALSPAAYTALMGAAQQVATLLKERLECDRVLLWVQGFEVPHVHMHLLPATGSFPILREPLTLTKERMQEIHDHILGNRAHGGS